MKIDLHMHSKYSIEDGKDEIYYMLQKADELGIEYISITDHDNVNAYDEIRSIENKVKVKIINGVEIKTSICGGSVEVLVYGFNVSRMKEFLDNNYKEIDKFKMLKSVLKHIAMKANKLGLIFNRDVFINPDVTKYESDIFWDEVVLYEENKTILKNVFGEGKPNLFREYLSNPDSDWYYEPYANRMDVNKIIKISHELGGLIFLAHPFKYGRDNIKLLLDKCKDLGIDGIECFHMSGTKEQQNYLVRYAEDNDMYISGGSDYHNSYGKDRMGPQLDFKIDSSYIWKWLLKLCNNL